VISGFYHIDIPSYRIPEAMKNAKAVECMGALGCRHFPGGQVSDIRRIVELRRSRSGATPLIIALRGCRAALKTRIGR
jgi:hypothetical protein